MVISASLFTFLSLVNQYFIYLSLVLDLAWLQALEVAFGILSFLY